MNIEGLNPGSKIYFVGIGGISMSGLARIAYNYGYKVAGSDGHLSERTDELVQSGIPVYQQENDANIISFAPDLVVYTAAILPGNPELTYSRNRGITTVERSVFLGMLTNSFKDVINISGTHGKTTTTAMVTLILMESGIHPTMHLGAEMPAFKSSVYMGNGDGLFVSEACEFKRSFLEFRSTVACITNIDYDHVDCYKDIDEVIEAFAKFSEKITPNGYLVVSANDKNIEKALSLMPAYREALSLPMPTVITTGVEGELSDDFTKEPDFYATHVVFENGLAHFDVMHDGKLFTHIELKIPGTHNVRNALNAIACASLLGASPKAAHDALASFTGADGRFTYKGIYHGAAIITDYAHHPSATKATLEAASNMDFKHIWVVYQPLTYNRVEALFNDYVAALVPCERVLFSEIFTDRENVENQKISSKDIVASINEQGGNAEFFASKEDIIEALNVCVHEGDLILILGPEDIRALGDRLAAIEKEKAGVSV